MTEHRNIVIANGALGTMLMARGVSPTGIPQLPVTDPQLLTTLYDDYMSAGATLLTTNTIALTDRYDCPTLCRRAVEIATDTGAMTAASIGPMVTDTQLRTMLMSMETCDYLLVETSVSARRSTDIAALIRELYPEAKLIVSATATDDRHMPDGTRVDDWARMMQTFTPAAIGLNCGTDSTPMCRAMLRVADATDYPLYFAPSAGTPTKTEAPAAWATNVAAVIESVAGRAIIAGGCCNTTPAHIAALHDMLKNRI